MKILDRYVAKNFLVGYAIAFCVLIGLRIIIDLFVNLDEFTEHADLGTLAVIKNILTFYCLNSTLYFRDFAGMITVVAAAFSLGKMVRSNELVAVMASGVSLKRVIGPIVILALLLTALLVIDQEFIIPPLADKLVRDQDAIAGRESYDVDFITDGRGSLICSPSFDVATATLHNPTIITRSKIPKGPPDLANRKSQIANRESQIANRESQIANDKSQIANSDRRLAISDKRPDSPIWQVTGRISAEKAVYNPETGRWDLINGRFTGVPNRAFASQQPDKRSLSSPEKDVPPVWRAAQPIASYTSDITPKDIPVRRKARHKTLLSWRQLAALAAQRTKIRDLAQLYSEKHFRITEPIINLVMLMVSLPILVCRDPKSMKSAIVISFAATAGCFVTTFICKMLAVEAVGGKVMPELWAWLPIFIFLPIAFIELDSMKT